MRQRVNGPWVVQATRRELSSNKTLSFGAAFKRSRRPEPDDVARVLGFTTVWCQCPFLPPFFSLPHLDCCTSPLKIQEQPFNLFVLQIWSLFIFIMIFLSWIIYWIWSSFFWLFFLIIFSIDFVLRFDSPLLFFPIKFNPSYFDYQFFRIDKFLF
jgi:hypothetical protein